MDSSFLMTKKDVFEYPLESLSENVTPQSLIKSLDSGTPPEKSRIPPKGLKLLIYLPGFRMVRAEFNEAQLQQKQTFSPKMEPLGTIRLSGRIVDTSGQGLSGLSVSVEYQLSEAGEFFGGADGFVRYLPVTRFVTGRDGTFSANIPALADDPFFNNGQFSLSVSAGLPFGVDLIPNLFSLADSRHELVITRPAPGILSGRVAGEFSSRNDLSPDAIRSFSIRLVNSGGRVDSSDLHEDGSFELKVLPGLFDVTVSAGGKTFPVQRGFTIRDGQRELLEIKWSNREG